MKIQKTILISCLLFSMFSFLSSSVSANQDIDRRFIEEMIPHHEQAIQMAKLAEQKASHQEIKDMSKNIIEAQSREIDQMKKWYKDWYNTDVSITPMSDESIRRLENSENFDSAFIEEMVEHHQMAIIDARILEKLTDRPEMLDLANSIIENQTAEIYEMKKWKKEWQI